MSITIHTGEQLELDPSDIRLITFDWDEALPASASISTSTWTISALKQNGVTALTKDNETNAARTASVRLLATTATAGDKYVVANKVVTNESPAQTIERQIKVLIQNQ